MHRDSRVRINISIQFNLIETIFLSVSQPSAFRNFSKESSSTKNRHQSSKLEPSGGNGGGGGGGKRARTIFTADQLERMEREFHKQQYVVGHERVYLAEALNLTEAQVLKIINSNIKSVLEELHS